MQALLMCTRLIAGGRVCDLRFAIRTRPVAPSFDIVGQPPAVSGMLQHITDCLAVFGGAGPIHSSCLRQHGLLRPYLGQLALEFSYAASRCCLACAMDCCSQFQPVQVHAHGFSAQAPCSVSCTHSVGWWHVRLSRLARARQLPLVAAGRLLGIWRCHRFNCTPLFLCCFHQSTVPVAFVCNRRCYATGFVMLFVRC